MVNIIKITLPMPTANFFLIQAEEQSAAVSSSIIQHLYKAHTYVVMPDNV